MKKNTDALGKELMSAPDLDRFLENNEENFTSTSVAENIERLFQTKGITKSALARKAALSEVFLHQVFSGRRNPSRNRVLCICFGLSATVEETQELLRRCGYALLRPSDRREAIIIYGLHNGMELYAVNDKLMAEQEESLF